MPSNLLSRAALRSGFDEATGDIVLIQDADLEYDPNDYPALLEPFEKAGADVVSVDWRVDLAEAARRAGDRASLQGNVDPGLLFAPPELIGERVREAVEAARGARGHILNLGHGVLPGTPVEGVCAFTEAARSIGALDP